MPKKSIISKLKDWHLAIYAMMSIDGIAGGLIGIYMPIYFLSLGYSLTQIFLFYIVNNTAILFLFAFAGYFAKYFGVFRTLLARLVFLFVHLVLLYGLKEMPNAFYIISVLSAAEIAFLNFPLHVAFAKHTDHEAIDEKVSKMFAFPSLFGIAIPLTGASIAALLGFKALFLIAAFVYAVSIIPFFLMGNIPVEVNINLKRILGYAKRYKRYAVAELFMSITGEAEGYILPIFLFLSFHNIFSIGFIATFLSLGSAIFTLAIGKFSKKVERKRFLRAGALSLLIIWIGRFLAVDEISFYVLSVFAGFMSALVSVPFGAITYINTKENHIEDFTIFREIPLAIGRVGFYLVCLLLVTQIKFIFLIPLLSYAFLFFF